MSATEERIRPLEESEQALRRSLAEPPCVIGEVLAALQRMGRRPPPALLVRPEDAVKSVRGAILLGAVLPGHARSGRGAGRGFGDLLRVRGGLSLERSRLSADIAALRNERQRMTLLTEERQRKQSDAEKAVQAERQNAVAAARQVDNLKDLLSRLEQGLDSATRAARAAARAFDDKNDEADLATLTDPGRLAPTIAFASARGRLPMPVNGVKLRDFGASGGTERGLTVATRAGAQVIAPCDGWVVYSGPFRSTANS